MLAIPNIANPIPHINSGVLARRRYRRKIRITKSTITSEVVTGSQGTDLTVPSPTFLDAESIHEIYYRRREGTPRADAFSVSS
jgi:hypothetical protein